MTSYPEPGLFDAQSCPYCRDARAAGLTCCLHHGQPELIKIAQRPQAEEEAS